MSHGCLQGRRSPYSNRAACQTRPLLGRPSVQALIRSAVFDNRLQRTAQSSLSHLRQRRTQNHAQGIHEAAADIATKRNPHPLVKRNTTALPPVPHSFPSPGQGSTQSDAAPAILRVRVPSPAMPSHPPPGRPPTSSNQSPTPSAVGCIGVFGWLESAGGLRTVATLAV